MKKVALFRSLCWGVFLTLPLWASDSPKGFIEMPPAKDGSYLLGGRPGDNRRWGRPETIKALLLVAKEWNRRYKGKYKIRIGDISKKDGSHFPPHKTHRDGLRVDITTVPNVCSIHFPDQKITLELARLFVRFGAWRIFYNHPYVTSRLKEVQKLEKHDNHFHVEFDPRRIPQGEGPFVVAAPPVTEGAYVGLNHIKKTDAGYTGLVLRWTLLGASPRWQREVQVSLYDAQGRLLFTSERKRSSRTYFRLNYPLEDGQKYQWRVEIWPRRGESISTGLVPFQTDFTPPQVKALEPSDGAEVDSMPTFRWQYIDDTSQQESFQIQIDKNRDHRRINWQSERIYSRETNYRLPISLPKRSYYWRVVVWDGRGNSAASEWRKFRVKKRKKFSKYFVQVTSRALNLRKGPSTKFAIVARLRRGQRALVLGEQGEWLHVRVSLGGRVREGFIHRNYVQKSP